MHPDKETPPSTRNTITRYEIWINIPLLGKSSKVAGF